MKTDKLTIKPIETEIFHLGENLSSFVIKSLNDCPLLDDDVLAVTSKIVSLSENRVIGHDAIDKVDLVRQEADLFCCEIGFGVSLTIKEGLLIPSAGVDESNSETGGYILFPTNPQSSAQRLRAELLAHFGIQNLGIILTDSHTTPLRHGVTGVALAFAGFKPTQNMIGKLDLFGRPIKMTKMNLVDGLAASAVLMMGETKECRPLALIRGAPVEFCETVDPSEIRIPVENDLYYPMYKQFLR